MAFILKEKTINSPGVIIFTHKERFALEQMPRELLERLKSHYILGMHWGHYHRNLPAMSDITFHLAGKGSIRFAAGVDAKVLNLCSRNFTPAFFSKKPNVEKQWDFLCVARPITCKNIDRLFKIMRSLYDRNLKPKTLILCPAPEPIPVKYGWYSDIVNDYITTFTCEERERVSLWLVRQTDSLFPVSQEDMGFLYNSSRYFTLLSEQEGESRVVSEALLCGLKVICWEGLRGGGRDYLNENNSFQFRDYEQAVEVFSKVYQGKHDESFDVTTLVEEMREDYSVPRLKDFLKSLFDEKSLEFDGEIYSQRLDRCLPGHILTLPKEYRETLTNDVIVSSKMLSFLYWLIGERVQITGWQRFLYDTARPYKQKVIRKVKGMSDRFLRLFYKND